MTIAAIALTMALQTGPTYSIGGDTVPVLVPTWTSPRPLDTYEFEGWTYGFRDGKLIAKSRSGFEWSDLPRTSGGATTKKIKVLINLVTRTDTLTDRGFLWQRQASIFLDDFRSIKREVALFCHLVHVESLGKTDVEPVWRVDESLRFVDNPSALSSSYLETFINATAEKPSEGLGPFDSIVVMTPLFDRTIRGSTFDGTPVATVPLYGYFDRSRPGQLARAMYNGWLAAPSQAAFSQPDPLGAGPLPLLDPSEWTSSTPQLPEVTSSVPEDSLDASASTSDGLAVRAEFASLFAIKLGKSPVSQKSGWVFFSDVAAKPTDTEMLGVKSTPGSVQDTTSVMPFDPGQAEKVAVSGTISVKTTADPDRGSVCELKEMSVRRQGWVRLLGSFDASALGFLELWIKPRGATWPLDLVVQGDGKTRVFRMFGTAPEPIAGTMRYDEADTRSLSLKEEPVWQRVSVAHGFKRIDGVYLSTPPTSEEWVRTAMPTLLIDDVAAKGEASGDLTPIIDTAMAEDPAYGRAREARTTNDEASLLKMLEDKSDVVQLNAATRFQTIKNPTSVPALTLIARNYNPRLAEAGAKALANQGTEAAFGALRYNYQNALGDYVKQFTASVLPGIEDRKILSELALALNARRPEARAAAAKALGRQPFKEATMVLLAFLNDIDPVVRAAAIEAVPTKEPIPLARIIGYARNDKSDLVRRAAFLKLKEWGVPEAAEAAKDPSPRVRSVQ